MCPKNNQPKDNKKIEPKVQTIQPNLISDDKKLHGTVVISVERCKGCGFCIEFCPMEALKFSEQYNAKGYHSPMLVSADLCTGCDMCGLLCPDFAIYGLRIKRKENGKI